MKKTMALIRVSFLGLLTSFSGRRSGKKKVSALLLLVLVGAVSLLLSGVYSFAFAAVLAPSGLLRLLPVLMAGIGCLFSLLFTAMGAAGVVFSPRGMDLLFSLPVSAFSIMLSRLMALYLQNLFQLLLFLLPSGVAYFVFGGERGVEFALLLVVSTVFLAFLSTVLSALVGFLLALVNSRIQGKALLSNLFYLLFLAGVFYLSFQINPLLQNLMLYGDAIEGAFSGWLFPLGLFSGALSGDLGAFFAFAAISFLPFVGVTWLLGRSCHSLLTRLSSHAARSDYRLTALKGKSPFLALLKKEAGRFFATPLYLFNMGLGAILCVGLCVFCFLGRNSQELLVLTALADPLALAAAVLAFPLSLTASACVSISLEGKYLWILKEAPVSSRAILSAKTLLNSLLIWGGGFLGLPFLCLGFSLSPVDAALLMLLILILGVFVPAMGIAGNLLFPKMDALSEAVVIKQSASSFLGMMGGMAVAALFVGGYFLLGSYLGARWYLLAVSLLLGIVSFLLLSWSFRKAPAVLQDL